MFHFPAHKLFLCAFFSVSFGPKCDEKQWEISDATDPAIVTDKRQIQSLSSLICLLDSQRLLNTLLTLILQQQQQNKGKGKKPSHDGFDRTPEGVQKVQSGEVINGEIRAIIYMSVPCLSFGRDKQPRAASNSPSHLGQKCVWWLCAY